MYVIDVRIRDIYGKEIASAVPAREFTEMDTSGRIDIFRTYRILTGAECPDLDD